MTNPKWTTGPILWTENYEDETSETFAKAWFRLFSEEMPYRNKDYLEEFFTRDARFTRTLKDESFALQISAATSN